VLPVVQTGSPQMLGIESESEWPHQPQLGSNRHTRAADVTRILWDFRLVEDDV
jgi:hypothetical protein